LIALKKTTPKSYIEIRHFTQIEKKNLSLFEFFRHRVSDVIREEFADRLVLLEKEISRVKSSAAEQEARSKQDLVEKER
jgi:hypothetical protein